MYGIRTVWVNPEKRNQLFFQLPQLRLQFVEISVGLSLGMRQGLFDHQEFVQFVCDIKIRLLDLR